MLFHHPEVDILSKLDPYFHGYELHAVAVLAKRRLAQMLERKYRYTLWAAVVVVVVAKPNCGEFVYDQKAAVAVALAR